MNLYLFNQKRNRDLDEYLEKLFVSKDVFMKLNQKNRQLLLVGGGRSLLESSFSKLTMMDITNVDLAPPFEVTSRRHINIKGDFTEMSGYTNKFDEIWALYSLPLYSPDARSVFMFIMKSILAVKPQGCIRFFPLEFDNSAKMKTRDADYDLPTMECTNNVLEVLNIVDELGVDIKRFEREENNFHRREETVVLKLNCAYDRKKEINSIILKLIDEYNMDKRSVKKVNVFI